MSQAPNAKKQKTTATSAMGNRDSSSSSSSCLKTPLLTDDGSDSDTVLVDLVPAPADPQWRFAGLSELQWTELRKEEDAKKRRALWMTYARPIVVSVFHGVRTFELGLVNVILDHVPVPRALPDLSLVRSAMSRQSADIVFHNASNVAVEVYWQTFTGASKLYMELQPSHMYVQQTYLTHPWVARNKTTDALMLMNGAHWILPCEGPHVLTATITEEDYDVHNDVYTPPKYIKLETDVHMHGSGVVCNSSCAVDDKTPANNHDESKAGAADDDDDDDDTVIIDDDDEQLQSELVLSLDNDDHLAQLQLHGQRTSQSHSQTTSHGGSGSVSRSNSNAFAAVTSPTSSSSVAVQPTPSSSTSSSSSFRFASDTDTSAVATVATATAAGIDDDYDIVIAFDVQGSASASSAAAAAAATAVDDEFDPANQPGSPLPKRS